MVESGVFCLDSNIFLALMVPASTKAPQSEIESAEAIMRMLHRNSILCTTSAIAFAEIRWVLLREGIETFEMVDATLRHGLHKSLTIIDIDTHIASESAFFKWKYYSKKNAFSYNDGIFLATALRASSTALITTDPHLLSVEEIETLTPSGFIGKFGR